MEAPRPLNGLTCLVTGSAGFLGSNLVRALLARGCIVHGFDKAPATIEHPNLRWFRGDVRSATDLTPALEGVDTVFHTAAMIETVTHAPRAFAALVRSVNVEGTQTVIQTAQRQGVRRMVHTSSIVTVPEEERAGDGEDQEVRILAINGGRLTAFECHLGLAMGATVGVIEESGRAAAGLLVWLALPRPRPEPPPWSPGHRARQPPAQVAV